MYSSIHWCWGGSFFSFWWPTALNHVWHHILLSVGTSIQHTSCQWCTFVGCILDKKKRIPSWELTAEMGQKRKWNAISGSQNLQLPIIQAKAQLLKELHVSFWLSRTIASPVVLHAAIHFGIVKAFILGFEWGLNQRDTVPLESIVVLTGICQ